MERGITEHSTAKPDAAPELKIKLQIYCGKEIAMGPGKADLLEAIAREGSISAAARALGMSYRRAWLLVDTMNRCWSEPLVETGPGSPGRAGAHVTGLGASVIAAFRKMQDRALGLRDAGEWEGLREMLRGSPKQHQKD
ncbi:MAG: LysR family transcriptional regulator [Novosphingobium sp.]|nr:LysR family transcriptional regulator [Novosphingobium sp.]